ncbi:MBL fold metallo-hydrolase [Joostella sp. CR20]|uniref:MBL fold metallo-hydrolase n=1 Tax=Joostella sp. CR20 TaxID=2804312 RepID=UPI00313EC6B3
MILSILFLIGILISIYLLMVYFTPSFGGEITKEDKAIYQASANYKDNKFVNTKDVPKSNGFVGTVNILWKFLFTKVPNGRPNHPLTLQKIDSSNVANYNGPMRMFWFGHSAFLLQSDKHTILIDPMLGEVAAPYTWLGDKRFNDTLPIEIEKLPTIDAVLISHDHYDHLDYQSIQKLKDKVEMFYVPLGVGRHLKSWGVTPQKIIELDWWQEANFKDMKFVCTPAQHFSGRKFTNGQSTLWSSWVVKTDDFNVFFSGDSGYSNHFSAIGEKYGPFDFAMMECGQYNEMWPDIHMFPEQTAQAGVDVNAKVIMPIHWGAFKLALHDWRDPVERVVKKASELNLNIRVPKIGEPILIEDSKTDLEQFWWRD